MGFRRASALIATTAAIGLSLLSAPPASAVNASPGAATVDCASLSSYDDVTFTGPVGSTFTVTNAANVARCTVVGLAGATVTGLSQGAGPNELAAGATATFTITDTGGFYLSGGGSAMFTIQASGTVSSPALDEVYPTAYLNTNGGTCSGTLQHTALPGTIASFSTPSMMDCLRPDYKLAGWARQPDATSYDFAPGAPVPIGSSSFTLYAVWSPLGVAVTYDANVAMSTPCLKDGVDQETSASRQSGPFVVSPLSTAATTAPCAPDGYTLTGWATTGDGAVAFTPGQPFDSDLRLAGGKVRLIEPVDSSASAACCPTRSRSVGTPRVVAPVDDTGCTRSATRAVSIEPTADPGGQCEPGDSGAGATSFANGDSVTLYAVWGRTITSDCPALRGKPLWTFECTDFGSVPVGGTATLSVVVTNQSQSSKTLQLRDWPAAMTVNGSLRVVSNSCGVLPPKGTCTLKLSWTPAREGSLGSVPLIMCNNGNVNQCYQPSQAQQLSGTATAATTLVTYDVELTAPTTPLLTGTSTAVSVRALRNDTAAKNAEVGLELEGGITLADGTKTGTVRTDSTGVASFTVTGTLAGTAEVHAAFGNAAASVPVTISDVLIEFDKDSIKAGEEAKATITAAPNTRVKYTTFGKLAGLNPGKACGQAYSSRFWGMVSGLMRMAEPVTTDAEGHATVSTCGLLAPNPRGQSLHSTASANATGPGSISAVVVSQEHYCSYAGCPWGEVDDAAAASAELDVTTTINLTIRNGQIPVVASPPNPSVGTSYPNDYGVKVNITSPSSSGSRINARVTGADRPTLWIANRLEVATTMTPGVFPYSTTGFEASDGRRIYLTNGQDLRLYYVNGSPSGITPGVTMDVIVADVASILGKSYVVFPNAITLTSAPSQITGTSTRLNVSCDTTMGLDCTVATP